MQPIEAVVFDWDGTLVDSKRALVASFQETTAEVVGEPFPTALETLAQLREAGRRLGVATSKARIRLDLEMERTGIGELLDASISGDEVGVAKPDPEHVVDSLLDLVELAEVGSA